MELSVLRGGEGPVVPQGRWGWAAWVSEQESPRGEAAVCGEEGRTCPRRHMAPPGQETCRTLCKETASPVLGTKQELHK